jgi:hypothetical protein
LRIADLLERHGGYIRRAAQLAERAGYFVHAADLLDLAREPKRSAARSSLEFKMSSWSPWHLRAILSGVDDPIHPVRMAAMRGDGGALVAVLRRESVSRYGRDEAIEVVPLVGWTIPTGRSELARWVEVEYPAPCKTCGVRSLVEEMAARLDAAQAVNATALCQRLEHVLQVYGGVLRRRDVSIPLAVLDEIAPERLRSFRRY